LTAHGERVLPLLRDMEGKFQGLLLAMGGESGHFDHFYRYFQLMRSFNMKISARNQFLGHVTSVTRGAVNSEVILDIGGGDSLAAIITNESIHGLGLAVGVRACALITAAHTSSLP
jgi:molybdate transport system regulatory protein